MIITSTTRPEFKSVQLPIVKELNKMIDEHIEVKNPNYHRLCNDIIISTQTKREIKMHFYCTISISVLTLLIIPLSR
jgi:hypothetical protein